MENQAEKFANHKGLSGPFLGQVTPDFVVDKSWVADTLAENLEYRQLLAAAGIGPEYLSENHWNVNDSQHELLITVPLRTAILSIPGYREDLEENLFLYFEDKHQPEGYYAGYREAAAQVLLEWVPFAPMHEVATWVGLASDLLSTLSSERQENLLTVGNNS